MKTFRVTLLKKVEDGSVYRYEAPEVKYIPTDSEQSAILRAGIETYAQVNKCNITNVAYIIEPVNVVSV